MNEGEGSRTAERVAERRAQHQLLDDPLVFEDPIALRIIDRDVAQRLRANPKAFRESLLSSYLRAAFVARSRLAEDELSAAVGRGVRQYVVLGAGLDTFAYRNPFAGLRVFEVDHPNTQAAKKQRLAAAGIPIPDSLTFVPIDFATQQLPSALHAAGFNREASAFFSWLGVIPYLERDAILATFQFVGSLPAGSGIVADYGAPPSSLSWAGKLVFRRMAKRVESIGEPWKTFYAPDELAEILRSVGFSAVADYGPEEINRLYFDNRSDGLRIGQMLHIVKALV